MCRGISTKIPGGEYIMPAFDIKESRNIMFWILGIIVLLKVLPALLTALLPEVAHGLNNFAALVNTYVPGLGEIFRPSVIILIIIVVLAYVVFNKVTTTKGVGSGRGM